MAETRCSTGGDCEPAIRDVLRRYWAYDSLRPLQAEAINAGLRGRDSMVVLATGGGKSLCYQIPAVVAGRTDVVISPLISLMKDQVDGLRACGYPAAALHSGMTSAEQRRAERDLAAGQCRLLFLAPERLQTTTTRGLLDQARVRAFAIDEAHCISHWGHDFRPEYRQLAFLRRQFPDASLHAFTATATPRVRADIVAQLALRDPLLLVGGFDRPNLTYRVVPKESAHLQVAGVLARHARQAAIVYCLARAQTELMAEYLRSQGLRAAHYHAGMNADDRRRTQDEFSAEKIDVVVATVAFGMGIDRGDVRCVIHADLPKSLEHYQQETGRAGRDGLPAECVLLYSYADVARWQGIIDKSAADADDPQQTAAAARLLLDHMQRYGSGATCRHRVLSEYFGQAYTKATCDACDVCLGEVGDLTDATVTAQKILSCVARTGQRFGVAHIVEVLRGAGVARVRELGHDRLSTFGLLRDLDKKRLANLVHQLVDHGLLDRTADEYPILKLNAASWAVMRGQQTVRLRIPPEQVSPTPAEQQAMLDVDEGLFEALRTLRREISQELGVPPFVIFHDTTLTALAQRRPTTREGMQGISGIGAQKLETLGARFASAIRQYCAEHGLPTDRAAPPQSASASGPPYGGSSLKRTVALEQAFALFARGLPVEQVAAQMCRARSTTWGYLVDYIRQRRPASVSAWVSDEHYEQIRAAFCAVDTPYLTPIYQHLGGRFPYEELRIVAAHLATTSEPGSARTEPAAGA